MRVAMISVHACPLAVLGGPTSGGLNLYVRKLAQELGRLGVEVDVFTRAENYVAPKVIKMGRKVRVIHLRAGPRRHFSPKTIFPYLKEFLQGAKSFGKDEGRQYDLVHGHYWLSAWVGQRLAKNWQVPLICMFHTLGRQKNEVAREEAEREPQVRIEVEEQAIKAADKIIAATQEEKRELVTFYKAMARSIEIIPPGVDLSLFYPQGKQAAREKLGIKFGGKIILFVGRLDPVKRIETLLRSVALLPKGDFCLFIIGGKVSKKDNQMNRLAKLTASLGIGSRVRFLGSQSQKRVALYYSASDIFVLPSAYESFGLSVLEAMASGVAVVASRVGGLPFLVKEGQTGFLFPSGNQQALREKLEILMRNDRLRERLGRNATVEAVSYSWQAVARKILAVYQNLVKVDI